MIFFTSEPLIFFTSESYQKQQKNSNKIIYILLTLLTGYVRMPVIIDVRAVVNSPFS